MTNREPTPPDAALVAIDVSKARNDVLIELPGSARRKRLVVVNTKAEHDRFVEILATWLNAEGVSGLFETTARRGERGGQLGAHSNPLRALPRKDECGFHHVSRQSARLCSKRGDTSVPRRAAASYFDSLRTWRPR